MINSYRYYNILNSRSCIISNAYQNSDITKFDSGIQYAYLFNPLGEVIGNRQKLLTCLTTYYVLTFKKNELCGFRNIPYGYDD